MSKLLATQFRCPSWGEIAHRNGWRQECSDEISGLNFKPNSLRIRRAPRLENSDASPDQIRLRLPFRGQEGLDPGAGPGDCRVPRSAGAEQHAVIGAHRHLGGSSPQADTLTDSPRSEVDKRSEPR